MEITCALELVHIALPPPPIHLCKESLSFQWFMEDDRL
jgi:hypothetical protein